MAAEVDLKWSAYKDLPGVDSSYNTKEAREEIEEEVRDERASEKDLIADVCFVLYNLRA